MNEKLASIAQKAASNLVAQMKEGETDILAAWDKGVEEAQANENKLKFKLSFTIALDLDADKMTTKLGWSILQSLSVESAIPDPAQAELPGYDVRDGIAKGSPLRGMTTEGYEPGSAPLSPRDRVDEAMERGEVL